MKEIIDKEFNNLIKNYSRCILDYCLIECDQYNGKESHKKAAIFAMDIWTKKYKEEDYEIRSNYDKIDMEIMEANKYFYESTNDKKSLKEMFLNPPHGTKYTNNDYEIVLNTLFPNGIDKLEIYDFSNDWSTYFEEGLEWWGARLATIYDKSRNRFVVIGASATD